MRVDEAVLRSTEDRLGVPLPAALRDDGGMWLWVHGRTPEAVRAVRDRLPGDWLMVPDD